MTVDGKPACVYFISPVQNALVPADPDLGTVEVSVNHSTLASNNATATMQAVAPALFTLADGNAAALHANNTIVGPTTLYANDSTPASPGETIMLFGTGFGPGNTPIPNGEMITTPIPIAGVTAMVGGATATVAYQALVMAGVYQINVTIPASTPAGNAPVVLNIGGQATQSGVMINVN